MPSGSIYTYVANANPGDGTNQIVTSQGTVPLGGYGYFLPDEVVIAESKGLILEAGIVGPAQPGSTGPRLVSTLKSTSGTVPVADGNGGYTWEAEALIGAVIDINASGAIEIDSTGITNGEGLIYDSSSGKLKPGSSGGLPSGTTAQTIIYDSTNTPHARQPSELSLVAFGADPTGTNDSSVAMQAWMTAVVNGGAGCTGKAEPGTYKFGTAVGIYTPGGSGVGGGVGGFLLKGDPGATFEWTGGAGSGSAVFFHSCQGTVENINFTFSSSAYDGNLVDVDWGANPSDCQMKFHGCQFGVRTMQNPRCVLRLNHTIITTLRECHFYGGNYAVLVGDGSYVIGLAIRDCSFNNSTTRHIYWAGSGDTESIVIDGNTFEPLASGAPGAIDTQSTNSPIALTISNNWFGDTTVSGDQISITAGYIGPNNRFYGTGYAFKLYANNSMVIEGNSIGVTPFDPASSNLIGVYGNNGGQLVAGDAVSASSNATTVGRSSDTTGYYPPMQAGVAGFGPTPQSVSSHSSVNATATGIIGYQANTIAQAAQASNANLGAIGFGSGGGITLQPATNDAEVVIRDPSGNNIIGAYTQFGTHYLGFFNKAAYGSWTAQPSNPGSATGYAAGTTAGTFHEDDTYTGNVGTTAYTLNGIVAALKNLGLIAS